MKRILMLVALLLAVPLASLLTARYVLSENNASLRQALHEQFPEVASEKLDKATVDLLCSERTSAFEEVCSTNDSLHLMESGALASIAAGLGLLVLIRLAGDVAKNSRTLLLLIFRPGLYLAALILIGLVLTHASLAMATIYFGESAAIGRIHVGIIAAIGIGALAGAWAIIRHSLAFLHKATTQAIGISVSRDEAPKLWSLIDETARRLGSLTPDHAVVGLDPNFYVTEATVNCLSGSLTGRTLYCSLPLARIMTHDEFASVIGHELGHFKGQDTKFSAKFYPIYRGTTASLQALDQLGGQGAGGLALLPAIGVFGYFLESFSVAESRISRERELAADKAGASVSTPGGIASALVKLHAFSGIWGDLQLAAVEKLRDGQYFVNASILFAERAKEVASPEALEGIESLHLSHPTDSHPPLATRLEALGVTMANVKGAALAVSPPSSSLDLFESPEALEEHLSAQFQIYLATIAGIDIPSATPTPEG